jgi:hypothetical protein
VSRDLADALAYIARGHRRQAWVWAVVGFADLGIGVAACVHRAWWGALFCAAAAYLASWQWGRAYGRWKTTAAQAQLERRLS